MTILFGLIIKKQYLLEPEFAEQPIYFKVAYLIATMHIMISTLFVGFVFSECNLIACGQGYSINEETKEENFNSYRQVDIWRFETSKTGLEATSTWNMQVHHWLKYYVSLRLKDRTKPRGQLQAIPTLLTYLASALWHGIDAGYFFFFVGLGLLDVFGRIASSTKIAHTVKETVPGSILLPLVWLFNMFSLSYLGMAFVFMQYNKFKHMHSAFGHVLHYGIPLGILVVSMLPKQPR